MTTHVVLKTKQKTITLPYSFRTVFDLMYLWNIFVEITSVFFARSNQAKNKHFLLFKRCQCNHYFKWFQVKTKKAIVLQWYSILI